MPVKDDRIASLARRARHRFRESGYFREGSDFRDGFAVWSGTSFSAPYAAALLVTSLLKGAARTDDVLLEKVAQEALVQTGWTVSAASVVARFANSQGADPIFRLVDGATCPTADVSTASSGSGNTTTMSSPNPAAPGASSAPAQ